MKDLRRQVFAIKSLLSGLLPSTLLLCSKAVQPALSPARELVASLASALGDGCVAIIAAPATLRRN
jgi:hypothetical protein